MVLDFYSIFLGILFLCGAFLELLSCLSLFLGVSLVVLCLYKRPLGH